jgi:hypothetical protein
MDFESEQIAWLRVSLFLGDPQKYSALFGEFHRVSQQVDQYLA